MDAERRIQRIIQSRKTQWSDVPAEIAPTIARMKWRLSQWAKKEEAEQQQELEEWFNEEGFSYDVISNLIGELRSAESRKRLSTLKHDINKLRETRCKYLISLQANAVEAVRLKKLLHARPGEHVKRSPRLFSKSERQRIEEILHYNFEILYGRQNW